VTKHTGGAELQCYLLSEEFIKRGWQVEVFTSKPTGSINKQYYNSSVYYYYYNNYKMGLMTLFMVFMIALKTKSKYYYIRTDAKFLKTAFVWLSKLRNIKTIFALASDDDAKNISIMADYSYKKNMGLKPFLIYANALVSDTFTKNCTFKMDLVISQSRTQKEILRAVTGIESLTIRNSFYLDSTEVKKENIILWVGNMRPIKRPELFIILANELYFKGWKFIMIGKSDGEIKLDTGIKNINFHYLGELSYKETNKWFNRAKILINTSFTEGFPNTFIQAWFFKTLIISLNVDPEKLLSKMQYGTCAFGDFDLLKNNIRDAVNNYDKFIFNIKMPTYFHKKNLIL